MRDWPIIVFLPFFFYVVGLVTLWFRSKYRERAYLKKVSNLVKPPKEPLIVCFQCKWLENDENTDLRNFCPERKKQLNIKELQKGCELFALSKMRERAKMKFSE